MSALLHGSAVRTPRPLKIPYNHCPLLESIPHTSAFLHHQLLNKNLGMCIWLLGPESWAKALEPEEEVKRGCATQMFCLHGGKLALCPQVGVSTGLERRARCCVIKRRARCIHVEWLAEGGPPELSVLIPVTCECYLREQKRLGTRTLPQSLQKGLYSGRCGPQPSGTVREQMCVVSGHHLHGDLLQQQEGTNTHRKHLWTGPPPPRLQAPELGTAGFGERRSWVACGLLLLLVG